jgi:hypothetical protein
MRNAGPAPSRWTPRIARRRRGCEVCRKPACRFTKRLLDTSSVFSGHGRIHTPAIHHDSVKSAVRVTVLLAAAILLAWHGLLLSTPHNHADHAVPQEELACSASHPSSHTNHLHGSGRLLASHLCLACLAGSTVPDAPAAVTVNPVTDGHTAVVFAAIDLRSRIHTHLPLLRGPPLTT